MNTLRSSLLARRLDGWVNALTGLGGLRDRGRSAVVAPFAHLSDIEASWLYHGSDLARKIVDKLPTEALRRRWVTGSLDLDNALARWRVFDRVLEAWIWGRLYGRGALYLGISDRLGPQDSSLDETKIQKGDLLFLTPIEGQDLRPAARNENPKSVYYGETTHYSITSVAGRPTEHKIHASRFLIFGGARTSERLRLERNGADLSVLQAVAELLRDTDQSWRGVMLLLQDLSQAVFRIKGLVSMIANGDQDVVQRRMEIVDMARSIARAVVVDADGESFEHVGAANVTGVGPLLDQINQRLAGASDMPMTVLFGISPGGMNATGESDLALWRQSADAARVEITPQAEKLTRIIARTSGLAYDGGIQWPPLREASELERADLEARQAATAQVRIAAGLTDPRIELELWVTGKRPAEVIDMSDEALGGEDDEEPEQASSVVAGDVWIDTEDGHRLQIAAVADGSVYFMDLDSPAPGRQWRWRLASFLERSQRALDDPGAVAAVP